MKLFGITMIRIILHLVAALSAKSYVIPTSLKLKKCSVFLIISSHCPFKPIVIQNPMSLRCTLLKVANNLDPDQARLFLSGFEPHWRYCIVPLIWWLLCALSLFSLFRFFACGYGTVKKQKRGNKEKNATRKIEKRK